MPEITIKAFGFLGDILGFKTKRQAYAAKTVWELIEIMTVHHGEEFKKTLIDPTRSELRGSYKVLVNGRDISFVQGLSSPLKDGDTVAFVPPVGGG